MFNVKAHCSKLPEFGGFALENPSHEAEQMFLLEDIKALVATRATVLPRGIVIFYLLKNSRTQQSGYELDSKIYFVREQKEQNQFTGTFLCSDYQNYSDANARRVNSQSLYQFGFP